MSGGAAMMAFRQRRARAGGQPLEFGFEQLLKNEKSSQGLLETSNWRLGRGMGWRPNAASVTKASLTNSALSELAHATLSENRAYSVAIVVNCN